MPRKSKISQFDVHVIADVICECVSDISDIKFYGRDEESLLYDKKISFVILAHIIYIYLYIFPLDIIFKLFKIKMSGKFQLYFNILIF